VQLGQQLIAEALLGKSHQAVLHGVGHAPATVMLLDQLVLGLDLGRVMSLLLAIRSLMSLNT
jgi:hypothetical protein